MQVSNANDVKIYNLTSGKSVPDWLSERKRRALLKKDVEMSRRIELIQDFDMPGVSSCIGLSPDQQYVVVTGMYKPTMRCFDVNQMSMKFERCFDSEVMKLAFLSEDFSKLIFLQHDRYIEFHTQGGRYFRLRVPKYNRDMVYNEMSCDVYIACTGNEVYRLNLERGCFLSPFSTTASMVNTCKINSTYDLLFLGTEEGKIEAWDPRVGKNVATLDCATAVAEEIISAAGIPKISAMELNGSLQIGAGLSTGQVLLYDIRSNIPLLVKDHHNELPIKDLKFQSAGDLVYSLDSKCVKIWEKDTGKPYTSILSEKSLNSMCIVPNTGLLFITNEAPKVQVHYIPSVGPAPRWCSFLDNLTEELEESSVTTIYDNYKFITRQELDELGLSHLLGTNLLRAYMHGFFIDIRLHQKAKSMVEPFAFDDYKKRKINEKLDTLRDNRVKVAKLGNVNKDLAMKLMNESKPKKGSGKGGKGLLEDDRFQAMFQNPDFEIDSGSATFKLLHPVLVASNEAKPLKPASHPLLDDNFEDVDDSNHDDDEETDSENSSDDDMYVTEQQRRKLAKQENDLQSKPKLMFNPAFQSIKGSLNNEVKEITIKQTNRKASLGSRLQHLQESGEVQHLSNFGNKQMTFSLGKKKSDSRQEEAVRHHAERRKLRRSASSLHHNKESDR